MLGPKEAIVIIASPETNPDLFWATHFWTPDPIRFIQTQTEKFVLISQLEFARAKKEILNAHVLLHDKTTIAQTLHELGITNIKIDGNTFPYSYAQELELKGFKIIDTVTLFRERAVKTPQEILYIEEISKRTDEAIEQATEILREAKINSAGYLYIDDTPVTSELLKNIVTVYLWKYDCLGAHTIISSGKQAFEPHNEGSGPIKAHTPIVMDVFPRSLKTGYFTDTTRTFCKGIAPRTLRRMFDAVSNAQQNAIDILKSDLPARETGLIAETTLKQAGFKTSVTKGVPQGFIHGLGHGVGVEIHEAPSLQSNSKDILQAGNVLTVEPGLYYPHIGGIRIEDTLLVTENGYRSLTNSPKEQLEIA